MKQMIGIRGDINAKLYDSISGKLIQEQQVRNLITSVGLTYIYSRMKDATATAMTHMAIGSGTTPPAVGDTTMQTQLARVTLTSTNSSATDITYVATFPAGTGTGTVKECGMFNAPTGGTMIARSAALNLEKLSTMILVVTWTISMVNA